MTRCCVLFSDEQIEAETTINAVSHSLSVTRTSICVSCCCRCLLGPEGDFISDPAVLQVFCVSNENVCYSNRMVQNE